MLTEKAKELEAAVLSCLEIPAASGTGETSLTDLSFQRTEELWPALAGVTTVGALLPLASPIESFLSQGNVSVLHADQAFELHKIPLKDQEIVVSARLSKSKEIRGSHIIQVTEILCDTVGSEIGTGTTTLFVSGQEAVDGKDRSKKEGPSHENSSRLEVLAHTSARAGPVALARYGGASGDFNPIHFDPDAAKQAGFDRPIVHGMLIFTWVLWTFAAIARSPRPFRTRIRFLQPLLSLELAVIQLYADYSFSVTKGEEPARELVAKGSIHSFG